MTITFEYDPVKAAMNPVNHDGVTFREAESVFSSFDSRIVRDDLHSDYEERKLIFGYSDQGRVLTVSYTERTLPGQAYVVRLITARKATKKEREGYENSLRP